MPGDDLLLWYIVLGIVLVLSGTTLILAIAWLLSPREEPAPDEQPVTAELTPAG